MRVDDASALFQHIGGLLPALSGQVGAGGEGYITADDTGELAVADLLASLQHTYPEAGPHYWGSRTWSLLLWQPVYLSVMSVHLAGCLPSLNGMAQSGKPCFVSGFTVPCTSIASGETASLIQQAGQTLQSMGGRFLQMVQSLVKLHPKMAGRLLADSVMAALLFVQRCDSRFDNQQVLQLANCWLGAVGQPDGSGLLSVSWDDQPARLMMDRKVCCQHFRRNDGELCSSCPKLKPQERVERLKREWA